MGNKIVLIDVNKDKELIILNAEFYPIFNIGDTIKFHDEYYHIINREFNLDNDVTYIYLQ